MSWAIHHSQSEQVASEAEAAAINGDKDRAAELYRLSAEAEEQALDNLDPNKARTLGITAVSAASLWYKANEFRQAERVACRWIALGLLPEFATEQLQNILQRIWNERFFRESGIEFIQGEITISLAGGEVSTGAAPLVLVHRKANEVCSFLYRTVEMILNRPFRKRGNLDADILENFRPWLLQVPPGSYQFAVRLRKPTQLSLFPENIPEIEAVTQKFMQIVRTATQESLEELEQTVADSDYRNGFLKMSRNLAPTGKVFNRLELKSTTDPDTLPIVLFPESRQELNKILRLEREKEDVETREEQIVGVLRALHLDSDWLEVVPDDKLPIRIHQTGDVIDDIVGPMVNQRVIVNVGINQSGRYTYRDIELDE